MICTPTRQKSNKSVVILFEGESFEYLHVDYKSAPMKCLQPDAEIKHYSQTFGFTPTKCDYKYNPEEHLTVPGGTPSEYSYYYYESDWTDVSRRIPDSIKLMLLNCIKENNEAGYIFILFHHGCCFFAICVFKYKGSACITLRFH